MTNSTHALVVPRSVRAGAASVAIIGTIPIATVAFTLSFTALTELVHAHSSAGTTHGCGPLASTA